MDLIGRLDQVYNWTSTARFIFSPMHLLQRRVNTRQAVFTGYEYFPTQQAVRYTYQIERINNERYRYENVGGTWRRYTQRYVERFSETSIYGQMYEAIGGVAYNQGRLESVVTSELISAQWRDVAGSGTVVSGGPYEQYSDPWRLENTIEEYFNRSSSNLYAKLLPRKKYTGSACDRKSLRLAWGVYLRRGLRHARR